VVEFFLKPILLLTDFQPFSRERHCEADDSEAGRKRKGFLGAEPLATLTPALSHPMGEGEVVPASGPVRHPVIARSNTQANHSFDSSV
jgi:hypothetical protein